MFLKELEEKYGSAVRSYGIKTPDKSVLQKRLFISHSDVKMPPIEQTKPTQFTEQFKEIKEESDLPLKGMV